MEPVIVIERRNNVRAEFASAIVPAVDTERRQDSAGETVLAAVVSRQLLNLLLRLSPAH